MTGPDTADERWKKGLLGAANEDVPGAGALDRELARLGLATVAGAAVVAAGTSTSTAPAAMSGAGAGTAGAGVGVGGGVVAKGGVATLVAGWGLTKIAIVATVTVATTTSAWIGLRPSAEERAVTATASATASASATATGTASATATATATASATAKAVGSLGGARAEASGRNKRTTRPFETARAPNELATAPPVERAGSVAEEVALVDRARALAQENPNEALRVLDEHAAKFSAGVLRDEGAVVRVEALVAAGRRAEAERFAEPFIVGRAGTPMARRMSALLGRSNSPIP